MEVHSHTHTALDPDSPRGRKRWTHYFWEFLMLFLAVFCGFLAENLREHKVERHREKEYVQSLREDIITDTAILQSGIQVLMNNSVAGDSLVAMIQQDRTKSSEEIKKLYQYNLTSLKANLISLTDRTEAQLKNSGSMRLIINKKVIDAIVDYWKGGEKLKRIEEDLHDLRIKAREKSYLIFDSKFYSQQLINGERPVLADARLMTSEYISLTEFSNRIAHIKNIIGVFILYLKSQKEKSDSLRMVIDKEY